MDDLVERAREALEGVTDGPWATDEGGEVHKDGRVIYAWPRWSDTTYDERVERNMAFGAQARTLVPAMADRIEALEGGPGKAVEAVWEEYLDSERNKWTFRKEHVENAIYRTLAELTGGKDE